MKQYNVNRIPESQLEITGKGIDKLWNRAEELNDFCSPWKELKNTETSFRALWDEEYLFFQFHVLDDSIHIDKTDNSINSINVSDRVELFFRSDMSLDPYYCLEIDPTPRIMDFKARPNKNFDFNWNWSKEDLVVKSNSNEKGFCVEGKISISSLKNLDLIKGDEIQAGIYRAKYVATKRMTHEPTWLTWINPNTKTPNFHISSSFGILKLH